MSGRARLKCRVCRVTALARWRYLGVPLVLMLGGAGVGAAQLPAANIVGNISGNDVSVASSGSNANGGGQNVASAAVTNGGIVTVHSGQARLMLVSGGEIDACGPAKFTLLEAGDAITVALDIGSVRVQLPVSTNLRLFTPAIIATPLDINGEPRDVTVGLELDDSLCVKAASGALLLENQFSNEKLVVPQFGEFFLAQGRLAPVARPDGKCECQMSDARLVPSTPSLPVVGLTAPVHTEPARKPAAAEQEDAEEPNIEFSTLAHANEAHPVNPPPKRDAPAAPAESMPSYKIVMPPLAFSAASSALPPPPENTADMVLLIRTVEVQPEWEFKGHVDAPSPDEQAGNQNTGHPHGHQPKPAGEKSGFWARVKRLFSGSNT
jgi:hypothetical protein